MMGELKDRLKQPTPPFFKRLRKWIIWASSSLVTAGGGLIGVPAIVGSALGKTIEMPGLTQAGGTLIAIGAVAGVLGGLLTSLPVNVQDEQKEENK